MTPEEYEKERAYLMEHWSDYMKNQYTPLWKQDERV